MPQDLYVTVHRRTPDPALPDSRDRRITRMVQEAADKEKVEPVVEVEQKNGAGGTPSRLEAVAYRTLTRQTHGTREIPGATVTVEADDF